MQAKNLTFKYYQQSKKIVLENLDFTFDGFTVLLGDSGCGKSTLAMILAGLYPKHTGVLLQGSVTLNNKSISEMSNIERAKEISVMFQNADLQFCMANLRDELIFCLENISLDKKAVDERIKYATKLIGTEKYLNCKFDTLSGGEKQKCALTCMLALGSKYMIFDEPFANIDPKSADELAHLLWLLHKNNNIHILIIDHIYKRWINYPCKMLKMRDNSNIDIFDKNTTEIVTPKDEIKSLQDAIIFENFTLKADDIELLSNTNFKIAKGTITALTGHSGCGKTTLLKTIYGKGKYKGSITVLDEKVCRKNFKKLCQSIGIVLQNPQNQFAKYTVLEEVLYSLLLWDKHATSEKAIELLDTFGLKMYQKYSPFMLSQGQQRRLAVLSVLCSGQKILLLDEPTYGQDAKSLKAIMDLLYDKVKNEGITVILTTHDEDLVQNYCSYHYTISDSIVRRVK